MQKKSLSMQDASLAPRSRARKIKRSLLKRNVFKLSFKILEFVLLVLRIGQVIYEFLKK